jgi:hypothetical protein
MGNVLWQKRFGGAGSQDANQLVVDAAGNIVVLGLFNDTIDFGGGPLVGPSDLSLRAIFIAKLDPSGNHLWSKTFGLGSIPMATHSLAADSAGNVVFTGTRVGTIDFGGGPLAGPGNTYLVKLGAAGNHVFSKSYDVQYAYVATTAAGALALVGSSVVVPANLGGGPLPQFGAQDLFVARLDPSGAHVWSKSFGAVGNETAGAAAIDGDQNIVFTVVSSSSADYGGGPLPDAQLVKLDPSGSYLWARSLTGTAFAHMETGSGNAIYLSGSAMDTVDYGGGPLLPAGNQDVVVVKLDAAGQLVHALRAGNDQAQRALWISPRGGQGTALAGFFAGTMDLGAGPMSCNGSSCAFVASFPP